jgi:cyclopropane fatty-acyl-phospholipid synthase-like methyltransferase
MEKETKDILEEIISLCKKMNNALDLGCGNGAHSIFLTQKGFEVTGVDFSEKTLNKLQERIKERLIKRIEIINVDIVNFVPVKKYDLILTLSVLHFFKLQTAKDILKKAKNWLEDDGIL